MKPEKIEGQTIQQWAERAKISEKALHDYIAAIRPTPPTTKPSGEAVEYILKMKKSLEGAGLYGFATDCDRLLRMLASPQPPTKEPK